MNRGILVVFEGIDGSGKSTQARRLVSVLETRGVETAFFREPSDSRWGREIREKAVAEDSLSPQEELDLFMKDRKENVALNLRPALSAGKAVVLDRYYFSSMAYQGAKGIDPDWIRRRNEEFSIPPDLVFIIDVDPATGLDRIKDREIKDLLFEREDYLAKVRAIFQSLQGKPFVHLDGRGSPDKIAGRIEKITLNYLKKCI